MKERIIREELEKILDYNSNGDDEDIGDVLDTIIHRVCCLCDLIDTDEELPFCSEWPWSK